MGSISIVVQPGSTVRTNITRVAGSKPVVAYSDASMTTPVALPANLTSTAKWWIEDDTYDVSVRIAGLDAGSRRVSLYGNQAIAMSAALDDADLTSLLSESEGNVTSFGAVGDGVNIDGPAIQAALDAAYSVGGGTVYVPVGTYLISTPLVIGSNVTFAVDPAATIALLPGADCNLIQNRAVSTSVKSVADGAITTGTNILTSASAPFTVSDIGRSVVVAGAATGINGKPLVGTISGYTNTTTVTLSVTAGTTVSGATVTIYDRDSNITISGGTWARGSSIGINNNRHSIFIRRADRVAITGGRSTSSAGKYAIAIGDVSDFCVQDWFFSTASDGVHVNGPAVDGLIRNLHGTTLDDMVSLTATDFTSYNDVQGDITDVTIRDVFPTGSLTAAKVVSGTGTACKRITITGVRGTTINSGVYLADDTNMGTSTLDDITVEDINVTTGTTQWPVRAGATNTGTLSVRRVTGNSQSTNILRVEGTGTTRNLLVDDMVCTIATSTVSCIDVVSGATVNNLIVTRATIPTVSSPVGLVYVNGTVNNLTVADTRILKASGGDPVVYNFGTLGTVTFNGVTIRSGGRFIRSNSSGAVAVVINACVLDGAWDIAQVSGPTTFAIAGLHINNTQTNLIRLAGASASATVSAHGITDANSRQWFFRDSTQVINVRSFAVRADLSILAKTKGDMAYNTNNALSCGDGLCVSDGTNWKNLYTGLTY